MRRLVIGTATVMLVVVFLLVGPAVASDHTTAKTLVINRADVGTSYSAAAATPSTDISGQLASCEGRPTPQRTVTAQLDGSNLTDQQAGSQISSSVEFLRTPAMTSADRAFAADDSQSHDRRIHRRHGRSNGFTQFIRRLGGCRGHENRGQHGRHYQNSSQHSLSSHPVH